MKTLSPEHPLCARNLGSTTYAQISRISSNPNEESLVLLDLLHAKEGSQLLSLARTMARVEPLSHVLAVRRANLTRCAT